AINQFNTVSISRCDNVLLKKRICGTGGLHGVRDRAAEPRNKCGMPAVGLCHTALEDHRLFELPPCSHDSHARLDFRESAIAENSLCEMRQGRGFSALRPLAHDCRHMLLVEFMNFINTIAERK